MLLATHNNNEIEYYSDGSGVITYPNGIRQLLSIQEVEELKQQATQQIPSNKELRYENA